MERLSGFDIWQVLAGSWKQILLVTVLVTVVLGPVLWLVIPDRYEVSSSLEIPFANVNPDSLGVQVRREIIPQLHEEMELADYGVSLARLDKDLVMYVESEIRMIYFGLTGNDPEMLAELLNALNLKTLLQARDMQIEYHEERIERDEEAIEEIEEDLEDEFVAEYYAKQFERWQELLAASKEPHTYVYLEMDDQIKNLHVEKKDLEKSIRRHKRNITELSKFKEKDMQEYFTPVYVPESPLAPRPVHAVIGAALLGLVAGFLAAVARQAGRGKRNAGRQECKA